MQKGIRIERASIAATGMMTINSTNFRIGWDGNLYRYTGIIDEVRIYKRALSGSEIQQLVA